MSRKTYFEVVELHNLTTNSNLLKNQPDSLIEAIEYSDNSIAFEAAERSCGQGQLVSVEGNIHLPQTTQPFQATGKISSITQIGNKRIKINVHIHSFDKKIWAEFIQALQHNQTELDSLFQAMRGEE